jgi:quercetin dioxygenase-like cupin family protein
MRQVDEVPSHGRPMPTPFTVARQHEQRLNVVGEQITVLASGAATGSYEIFRQVGPEGSGPPLHTHPWDESFYVIAGEITFNIDDREGIAGPGTLVHLPAGTTHGFRFGNGGGEMLSITSREGASHLFVELDREVSTEHPDLAKLIEVSVRHGLEIVVPPS